PTHAIPLGQVCPAEQSRWQAPRPPLTHTGAASPSGARSHSDTSKQPVVQVRVSAAQVMASPLTKPSQSAIASQGPEYWPPSGHSGSSSIGGSPPVPGPGSSPQACAGLAQVEQSAKPW